MMIRRVKDVTLQSRFLKIVCAVVLASVSYFTFTQLVIAQDGPNHNVVFLIDSSPSIADPADNTDPENKRIRFSRFIVRYMQAFYPDQGRVGVFRFHGEVEDKDELVPLMFVEEWTTADLNAIGNADEAKSGTNFIRALEAARDHLLEQDFECGADEVCHIVLFTDGQIGSEADKDILDLVDTLKKEHNIHVIVALFQADLANQDSWRSIAEVVDADASVSDVYSNILQSLEIDGPLSDLELLPFTQTTTLSTPVSRFHRVINFTLLADSPIEEEWTLPPTIDVGLERWWIDPPEGQIRVTLEATDSALLYYAYQDELYPVDLQAMIVPEHVATSQPVELYSWFSAGGKVITRTKGYSVQVHLEPGGMSLPLKSEIDGRFVQTITPTTPGTYAVTFTPTLPFSLANMTVHKQKYTFLVGEVPGLELRTGARVTTTNGVKVPITVTVENYVTIAGLYTPTLRVEVNEHQNPITLSFGGKGLFTASVQVSPTEQVILRAFLPGGRTWDGIRFLDQWAVDSSRAINMESTVRLVRSKLFFLPWLLVLLLTILFVVKHCSRKPRPGVADRLEHLESKYPDKNPNEIEKECDAILDDLSTGGLEFMRKDIRAIGKLVAGFYSRNRMMNSDD